jgi:hypothetical protein
MNRAAYLGGTIHIARGELQIAEVCAGQAKIARLAGQWVRYQD